MERFNQILVEMLSPVVGVAKSDLEAAIESPQDPTKGDRALPTFRFAKEKKVSPQNLAEEWKKAVAKSLSPQIERVESAGGYLNFFFKRTFLATEVLGEIHLHPGKFGFCAPDPAPIAVIEFSSPNIAKPFSIGHLRTTNIGASLARIFEARGWRVIRINHLGDWGTQFGKLMSAFRRWGSAEQLDDHPIQKLFKLYVRWHEEEISDPTLIEEAREWFARLERGDEEAKELWTWFRDLTLRELKTLYDSLSVDFDYYWGESFYVDKVPALMEELKQKGITSESNDATIVNLEKESLGVAVLQKSDDTSLYLTRDLAAAIYRYLQFHFDRMIYVVGQPQKLHFQQLFKILSWMGHTWSEKCEHIGFGHMSFGDESMSTRKGNVVFLSEVMARAQEMAKTVVESKNPDLADKDKVAEAVGTAAVLFADLSSKRLKDVKFSWEEILSFDGETGPYLQYSLVRTQSLLRKYGKAVEPETGEGLFESDEEAALVRHLSMFPGVIARAEAEREPFYIAQHLIGLTKTFNKFYAAHRIIDAPERSARARMFLVSCVADVLKTGFSLLGLPMLEKM